jgi:hypothetical protein
MSTSVVMPAPEPRATPVSDGDLVRLRVLEAYIETLRAENEMLKRRLAAEVRLARSVPGVVSPSWARLTTGVP